MLSIKSPGVLCQERARFQIKMLINDLDQLHHNYNDWEERFITDIAKRLEEHPDMQLSDKQIDKINQIYGKESQ